MGALRGRTEAPQSSSRLLILQALLLQRMIETSTSLWSRSTHHAPMLRICRNYCCSNPETGAHRTQKFSRQRDFLRPTRILSGSHKTRVCTQIHVFFGSRKGQGVCPTAPELCNLAHGTMPFGYSFTRKSAQAVLGLSVRDWSRSNWL